MEPAARAGLPLEQAMAIAGTGFYTHLIMVFSGLIDLSAYCGIQLMSVVMPAAGCDLQLTTYQKGILTSMVYVGMICSSHLWGFLADTYGRRRVMLTCGLGTILVNLASSLAPNSLVIMLTTFLLGILLAGIYTPIYIYVGECCPEKVRAKALLITCAFGTLANAYLPATAWLIMPLDIKIPIFNTGIVFTSWRLYIACQIIPGIVAFFCLKSLPETPKFLLSKGKHDETMKVLKMIYARNHRKGEEDFPVLSVCLDSSDAMPEQEKSTSGAFINFFKTIISQTQMIFSPPLLKYAVLSCILNSGLIGIFNTILLWYPETVHRLVYYWRTLDTRSVRLCDVMLDESISHNNNSNDENACKIKDDFFIINIANGLAQGVLFVVFSFIVPRFKRKHLTVALSSLLTVACATIILSGEVIFTILMLSCTLLFLVLLFPVYTSIVVDFFPTSIRSNAFSIVMTCGRVSTVIFSQGIGALYDSYCEAAFPVLTLVLVGITTMFIFLPNKRSV